MQQSVMIFFCFDLLPLMRVVDDALMHVPEVFLFLKTTIN